MGFIGQGEDQITPSYLGCEWSGAADKLMLAVWFFDGRGK